MKNLNQLPTTLVATIYLLLLTFNSTAQIGINTTGADPDASALLDLSSTDKGFLITRADTADIPNPAFGLMTLSPKDSCLYMYNGKPKGQNWISLFGAGVTCNPTGSSGPEFPCGGTVIPVVDVTSKTGKVWMDRNLGAEQVATSSKDEAAYGDLYQWGRCSDGHEKTESKTTPTRTTSDDPGHGDFITPGANDWRNPKNDKLWQGASGINNPCPKGYRLPTQPEFEEERITWSSNKSDGAYSSTLQLTVGGNRSNTTGAPAFKDLNGYYWTSTVFNQYGKYLYITSANVSFANNHRSAGQSVRCIKD